MRRIAVELDPPAEAEASGFLEGAERLRRAGADLITIADSPMGRPRMDSALLSCKLKRERGIEPLPHLTCRDRNGIALRGLLLGLAMEGVHRVLLVTGDPVPREDPEGAKGVFQYNSPALIRTVRQWNDTVFSQPFRIYAALNVNSRNFSRQLERAKEKEAAGADGFFTQPVLSREALENLKQARDTLRGEIFGGIFPVVSERNARFLNDNVQGIRVGDEILARYIGADREQGQILAEEISCTMAAELAPWTNGLYLMTPFRRIGLMEAILRRIRGSGTEETGKDVRFSQKKD